MPKGAGEAEKGAVSSPDTVQVASPVQAAVEEVIELNRAVQQPVDPIPAIDAVNIAILERLPESIAPSDTWESGNKIIFQLLKYSRLLLVDATRQLEMPKPPKFQRDEEHWEENPNDPNYLDELQETLYRRANLIMTINLAQGSKIKHLPEGILPPEDETWVEDIKELAPHIVIPAKGKARYVAWIKYYALSGEMQAPDLNNAIVTYNGYVSERAVREAEEQFRNIEERRAASPNGTAAES